MRAQRQGEGLSTPPWDVHEPSLMYPVSTDHLRERARVRRRLEDYANERRLRHELDHPERNGRR